MQPVGKTVWRVLRKLELPCHPAIPPLEICPEKTIIKKRHVDPVFTAALFTTAKTWKQPKCPSTHGWIKKRQDIHRMGYYSDIKRMKRCHLQQLGCN